MKRKRLRPTARDGQEALRDHLIEKALLARSRYGPAIDSRAMRRLLADSEIVRFPAEIAFDAAPLRAGEFAWAMPRGDAPAAGFTLVIHPHFRDRPEVLPYLAAYHVPSICYLDIATHEEAELFGATLLGLDVDVYYERLCALADGIPTSPAE